MMLLFYVVLIMVTRSYSQIMDTDLRKFEINNNGFGKYSFEYETSDGTYRQEDGGLIDRGGTLTMVVRGEFGYMDPNGQLFTVEYVADENGFRAHRGDARLNDRRIV